MLHPISSLYLREAILVMDSRSTPSALRHQGFQAAWNKLYSVGSCYLDLSLKPEAGYSLLLGKVVGSVGHPAGAIYLLGAGGERLETAQLQSSGMFRLLIGRSGTYGLELELGTEHFIVPPIDVG